MNNRFPPRLSAVKALKSEADVSHSVAKKAVEDFKKEHELIASEFYSDCWKRLQFKDSQLVEYVLSKCLTLKIPLLPVHDSFIREYKE